MTAHGERAADERSARKSSRGGESASVSEDAHGPFDARAARLQTGIYEELQASVTRVRGRRP